jgi:23S rRNA (cytosine1962-C5)-methyltransferase
MVSSPHPSRTIHLLENAIAVRAPWLSSSHEAAFRLFNGFSEGDPNIVIDVYGCTFLIHDYADEPEQNHELINEIVRVLQNKLNWLRAGVLKTRNGKLLEERRGRLIFGTRADHRIKEHDIWYAVNLMVNRDASLYLDTRNLRKWLIDHSAGQSVLNAFAYTGSFGVAAMAGGASRVVQLDRTREFLNIAKDSYGMNNLPIRKTDFIAADFFSQVSKFKRSGELFDCVLLDPPYFSTSARGTVDQEQESARLINKVRPLLSDGGTLIAINNALFVSGQQYLKVLESLCQDGYLKIKEFIPVPEDFIGYPGVHPVKSITDPAPFNHSTKIAVLQAGRKDKAKVQGP